MSFTLSRVDTLFPIPLFRYRVEEAGLNDRLSKEIVQRRKAEQGMANRNRRGWQSEHDFFQRKEEGHIALALGIAPRGTGREIDSLQPRQPRAVQRSGGVPVGP